MSDKRIPEVLRTIEGIKETISYNVSSSISTANCYLCLVCEAVPEEQCLVSDPDVGCSSCIMEHDSVDVSKHCDVPQFLLDRGLITKAQALELTLEFS